MKILCPVRKCVWGPINSQEDLVKYIAKSGQPFGVDESGPACEFNPTYPCDKTLYEYMGWGTHKGLDIPCASGTEVYASHDGKVTRISDVITQGIGVVIWDPIQSIESVYWHLLSHSVGIGDIVKKGQLIALSDNTGFSKGNHLHFQVNLTDEHGQSLNAVDPMPYFVWNDMRFVKVGVDGVEIWIINNSKRSHISNSDAFTLLNGNWASIEVITQAELDLIPDTGMELLAWQQK